MIDDNSINAFGDELEKIAGMIGNLGKSMRNMASIGWNKPAGLYEKALHTSGPNIGKKMVDEAGKQIWHERPNATWLGRGNITKYLPVGDKSILTGITAMGVPSAVKKEDPEGMGRSRAERISGLAGGTIGSLIGMGAMARIPGARIAGKLMPMRSLGVTRSIIGGLGGGIMGERMATESFRRAKAELPASQSVPEQSAPVLGANS